MCGHGYDYNAVGKGSAQIVDMVMNTGSLPAGFCLGENLNFGVFSDVV